MNETCPQNHENHGHRHSGRGPSSFRMHDPDVVFGELNLEAGESFLDLGCGPGDYSLWAATMVGESGTVYALDQSSFMLEGLSSLAAERGLKNIMPIRADITGTLPVKDHSIDVCLMATVLHIVNRPPDRKTLFEEIRRVLKPNGRLAIIECKKEDQNFGPPKHIRLSPEEVEEMCAPYGFKRLGYTDLGYNYIVQFTC